MMDYNTLITVSRMLDHQATYRQIHDRTGIGNQAITRTKRMMRDSGFSFAGLEAFSPEDLLDFFYPSKKRRDESIPLPDFEKIWKELNDPTVPTNIVFHWLQYKDEHPNGYQRTQFVKYVSEWIESNHGKTAVRMVVQRRPGEKMYIDWAGTTVPLVRDPATGNLKDAHLFVTTLGVSSLLFVRAFENERTAAVAEGVTEAFKFYRALPRILVPDNMKTAVERHNKDELVLSSLFKDLESFYKVIVVPPPARKPKGKPSVENGVKWAETHIFGRLKYKIFNNFDELNREIMTIVRLLNEDTSKKKTEQRQTIFESVDLPHMRPLPKDPFAVCEYESCTVPANYHIRLSDGHYYSVPYTFYRPKRTTVVTVKSTPYDVFICDQNNRLICTHKRTYDPFQKYVTNPDHMPPEHQYWKETESRDSKYYLRWAKKIGPHMHRFIQGVLYQYEHEQQAYNTLNGILHQCDHIPNGIAEQAAAKCIKEGKLTFSRFKYQLTVSQKQIEHPSNKNLSPEKPHQNIRGKEYYK
ncbi:IS21 family transposase [Dubosiella muris]|uniref:IS21 family transposase n=1 Tax=Dubosiella muris TaxID=3038133 RepID=A0AC61R897_9FIRM|nr:IS21 family transposase [Dubosiella muris]TGY66075.1 IS21 family transposase [Dubosiella muris]